MELAVQAYPDMAMMSAEGGSPSFRNSLGEQKLLGERGNGCILVADDDPDDIYLLRRALRKAGLFPKVVDVFDGTLAVSYLSGEPPFDDRLQYPFPDLVLLDLKMPKMNGFDVLAWLKGRPDMGSLPVIVLSSSSVEDDEAMALKMGAREFHTKPADIDNLLPLLRSLHRRWLQGQRAMDPEIWKSHLAVEQLLIRE